MGALGITVDEQRTMAAIQSINQKLPDIKLRDLFAMVAMNALLPTSFGEETSNENVAASAYSIADCMLEARKVK